MSSKRYLTRPTSKYLGALKYVSYMLRSSSYVLYHTLYRTQEHAHAVGENVCTMELLKMQVSQRNRPIKKAGKDLVRPWEKISCVHGLTYMMSRLCMHHQSIDDSTPLLFFITTSGARFALPNVLIPCQPTHGFPSYSRADGPFCRGCRSASSTVVRTAGVLAGCFPTEVSQTRRCLGHPKC